mmetsp:Transcript_2247/g.6228  ORF Transcript_2247/g.6228 Transcript_2247/m.6228 type:complete len:258 (+) Transcript_2247:122-895(+)
MLLRLGAREGRHHQAQRLARAGWLLQHTDDFLREPLDLGKVQCRLSALVLRCRGCAVGEKECDDEGVTLALARVVKGGFLAVGDMINVDLRGYGGQDLVALPQLAEVWKVVGRKVVKGKGAEHSGTVPGCPPVQQRPDHLQVPFLGSNVERRKMRLVSLVHIRPRVQQQLHNVHVLGRRNVHGCPPLAVALEEGLAAGTHHPLDRRHVLPHNGGEEALQTHLPLQVPGVPGHHAPVAPVAAIAGAHILGAGVLAAPR